MTATILSVSDLNTTINHEPRIRDLRLAEALSMADPHDIRRLIEAILALRRHQYRDGRIHITQNKTGARVSVPYSKEVGERIDAEIARQLARKIVGSEMAPLLLCETTGRAWNEHHFRHVFADIRKAAAEEWPVFQFNDATTVKMAELYFMHLRHTAVTELANAGCTTLEIAGITGHTPMSVENILNRYLVRTSSLANAATTKRLEHRRNEKV